MLIATLPWIVTGSSAVECKTAGLVEWLPDQHSERSRYETFVERFGTDDWVLVTWNDCRIDDPRLAAFSEKLAATDSQRDEADAFFERIVTGNGVLERLTSPPANLSYDAAVDRLTGSLIGPDQQATCAVITLTEQGRFYQKEAIQTVRNVAEECEIPAGDLRFGGTAYESVVLSEESERSLHDFTIPVTVLTLSVAWFCLRSFQLLMAVGLVAAYCRFMTMAAVYYSGSYLSVVLIVAPVLVYVLTMSGAVHLANYYRDVTRVDGPSGAAWRALGVGWKPCTLAVVSTSLGLISLLSSEIGLIRDFGYYSAVCLMISLVVLLAWVPSMLDLWPAGTALKVSDRFAGQDRPPIGGWLARSLPSFVIPRNRSVLIVSGVILCTCTYGLKFTQATVEIERTFGSDTPIIRDYAWIEEHIGPIGTIEILVEFDTSLHGDMLDQYRLVQSIDQTILQIPQVRRTVSAATFLPEPPPVRGVQGMVRSRIFRRQLQSQRDILVAERLLATDDGDDIWRISARVRTLEVQDYRTLADNMLHTIDASLKDGQTDGVTWTHTGLLPMVETAQRLLLRDLVMSCGGAFLLICPVIMLVLRSAPAGLIAMIPNIAPIILVFGFMGWVGYAVDIGSVLTASVALGIAVDDTLHFLNWFRKASDRGVSRHDAIRDAFQRCAPAMFQTTLICSLGLLVLVFCTFIPTQRFACLLSLLLFAALIGDLILLPAILASPLGRYFESRRRLQNDAQTNVD